VQGSDSANHKWQHRCVTLTDHWTELISTSTSIHREGTLILQHLCLSDWTLAERLLRLSPLSPSVRSPSHSKCIRDSLEQNYSPFPSIPGASIWLSPHLKPRLFSQHSTAKKINLQSQDECVIVRWQLLTAIPERKRVMPGSKFFAIRYTSVKLEYIKWLSLYHWPFNVC